MDSEMVDEGRCVYTSLALDAAGHAYSSHTGGGYRPGEYCAHRAGRLGFFEASSISRQAIDRCR
jgi:hypothetical protein